MGELGGCLVVACTSAASHGARPPRSASAPSRRPPRGVGRGLPRFAVGRRLGGLAGWRPGGGRTGAGAWGLDDEDPGGGDGGGHGGRAVTRHAELDTSFLAGAGEAGGILEDLDDL